MKWKEIVNDYLSFTRKERIGIVAILSIIVLAIFLPLFFSKGNSGALQTIDSTWAGALQKLDKNDQSKSNDPAENNFQEYQFDPSKENDYRKQAEVFYFDPNTLSAKGWQQLGFPARTIQTIQKYLAKGGRFKKTEDLQRIYGLRSEDYQRVAPYVKFEHQLSVKENSATENKNLQTSNPASRKPSSFNVIEINTADTSAFISLPGIGSKLALRIINFRDKLGGFHTVDQVKETFGLPDSTFEKIKTHLKLDNTWIRKININTATVDDLKAHPYIRYNLASTIIAYRNEHGQFSDIADLKKIITITDEVYQKIAPYLTLTL